MKRAILLCALLSALAILYTKHASAQRFYGTWMETNNITAALSTSGVIFGSNDSIGTGGSNSGFIIEDGEHYDLGTISSSGWWVGGIDNGGSLHLRVSKLANENSFSEMVPGPFAYNQSENWNYIWTVTKAEVDAHIADFSDNGVIDDPIPASILNWPGKGSQTAKGLNGVSINVNHSSAPFFDVDGDNIYTPSTGDYPLIKGDEMFWFVFHDDTNSVVGGTNIGMEVQVSAFAYDDNSVSGLNNAVFTEVKFINKSSNDYHNVYFGNYVDIDIACFNNDYYASMPSKDLFYGYNSNNLIDDQCTPTATGSNLAPVQYVLFVDRSMYSLLPYYNDYTPDYGHPETPTEYYNLIRGLWKDGSCITSDSCSGKGGSVCTTFAFPNDPGVSGTYPTVWSESACGNPHSDRRGVGATGPYNWASGQALTITMLYGVFQVPTTNGAVPEFTTILNSTDAIVNHYMNDPNYVGINDKSLPKITASIYPNPSRGLFTLSVSELKGSVNMEVYNLLGEQVVGARKVTNSNTPVDLSHLQDGIFLVKVGNEVLRVVKHQ